MKYVIVFDKDLYTISDVGATALFTPFVLFITSIDSLFFFWRSFFIYSLFHESCPNVWHSNAKRKKRKVHQVKSILNVEWTSLSKCTGHANLFTGFICLSIQLVLRSFFFLYIFYDSFLLKFYLTMPFNF